MDLGMLDVVVSASATGLDQSVIHHPVDKGLVEREKM